MRCHQLRIFRWVRWSEPLGVLLPIPGDRAPQALPKIRLGPKPKDVFSSGRLQAAAGLAVRLRRIPHQLALKPHELRD